MIRRPIRAKDDSVWAERYSGECSCRMDKKTRRDSWHDKRLYQGGEVVIIKQFDTVLLKDGRMAAVMEAFENKVFIVDVGDSPEDWDTISITIDDIEKVLYSA